MESREQAEQAAISWIARRETGPWSPADATAFEQWLAGSTTREVAYYRFKKTWQETGRLEALSNGPLPERPLADAFEALNASALGRSGSARRWYALAACVVLSVSAALFVFRDEVLGVHRYATAVGGLTAIPLPDGSRVTLNTDSRLRVSITDRERRMILERGEAYFEVAKDPRRPFVVAAGEKRVVAVGTSFSVRRQGEDIRVSVTEGAVRFLAFPGQPSQLPQSGAAVAPRDQGVLLPSGSVAHVESTGVLVEQKPVAEIEQQLTWRSGVLTFRDTPLVDAVGEFNRYNERKIFIEDPDIAAIEVGGVFRSTDLDPFIRLIENGLALRVSQNGDRIVLSAR